MAAAAAARGGRTGGGGSGGGDGYGGGSGCERKRHPNARTVSDDGFGYIRYDITRRACTPADVETTVRDACDGTAAARACVRTAVLSGNRAANDQTDGVRLRLAGLGGGGGA